MPLRVGGPVDGVQVSLRFFGDDLEPDEITRALGHFPTEAFRKGDARDGGGAARTSGGWLLTGPATDPQTVENTIRALLALLSPDLRAWRSLTRRFHADVFCGIFMDEFNRGFEVSPALMRELAARGLVVGFDIYGPGMPSFGGDERPDLGAMLARGQLPDKRLLRRMARRELAASDSLEAELWLTLAAVILDDAALFDDVVRRHWRRRGKARHGGGVEALAPRHRRRRAAKELARRARAIVALAPPALADTLRARLDAWEAAHG
jgi:hypothetical protein